MKHYSVYLNKKDKKNKQIMEAITPEEMEVRVWL